MKTLRLIALVLVASVAAAQQAKGATAQMVSSTVVLGSTGEGIEYIGQVYYIGPDVQGGFCGQEVRFTLTDADTAVTARQKRTDAVVAAAALCPNTDGTMGVTVARTSVLMDEITRGQ